METFKLILTTQSALIWVAMVAFFLFVGFLGWRDYNLEQRQDYAPSRIPTSVLFVLISAGIVAFLAVLWNIAPDNDGRSSAGFGSVAGLVLVGLAVFLGILGLLSWSAGRLGILNDNQPFGLPDGTVRAFLTVAFIVLVGVLSSYLITGYQNRSPFHPDGIVVERGVPVANIDERAARQRAQMGADALVVIVGANPQQSPAVFDIRVHPRLDTRVADDIAKQTLTMISTILAAMIGFYFAARSGGDGADVMAVNRAKKNAELLEYISKNDPEAKAASLKDDIAVAAGQLGDAAQPLVDQADAHVKAAAAARATLNNPSSTFQELDAALKSVMQLGTELGNTRKALVAALNNGAPAKVAPEEVQALKDGFDKAGTQVVDLRKRVAMSKENQSEEEKNADLKKVDEAQSDINAAKQSLDGEGVTAESLARLKAILGELKAKLDPLEGRYPKG